MFDFIFQGAIDENFTDWDSAREFVQYTIVNNPRFDGETKAKLQKIEEDAFKEHADVIYLTEKAEIARYYTYLRNQFPSVTDDERFLSIYDAAAEVKADEPSVGVKDFKVSNETKLSLAVVGLAGFTLYMLLRK